MGYIHGFKKNTTFSYPVSLPAVGSGQYLVGSALTDIFDADDFEVSINGGSFGALVNPPTISPAGSDQVVITLDISETPGPWTRVRYIETPTDPDPKTAMDNGWVFFLTNVGSGSGAVITVNPSAFIDAEAVANLVGPYVANLVSNLISAFTPEQRAALLAMIETVDAIKAKTDLITLTGSAVQAVVTGYSTAGIAAFVDNVDQAFTDIEIPDVVGGLTFPFSPREGLAFLVAKGHNGTRTSQTAETLRNAAGEDVASRVLDKQASYVDVGKFTTV